MSLRKLTGVVLPQFREPSTCEACGASFVCGAGLAGCWCSEIKLSAETRAELQRRYERCLCRSCLESFAARVDDKASDES
ncbi:MAG: cysteine-rich CWC family protein [Acidobacteriota bacterium]|nr:cysteine-rich CWC family protein [Acidobacteriota bacterium]